jgi:hypothetical protein
MGRALFVGAYPHIPRAHVVQQGTWMTSPYRLNNVYHRHSIRLLSGHTHRASLRSPTSHLPAEGLSVLFLSYNLIDFTQEKLELITGIPLGNQQLTIYNDDADSQSVKVLDDDQRPLGFYSPANFQVLKVRALVLNSMRGADSTYPGNRYQSSDVLHWPVNRSQRG